MGLAYSLNESHVRDHCERVGAQPGMRMALPFKLLPASKDSRIKLGMGTVVASAEPSPRTTEMTRARKPPGKAPERRGPLPPRVYVWHQLSQEVLVIVSTTAEGPQRR